MHLFAVFDCDFYHIDENRAFFNAPKLDKIKTIARIPGDPAYYEIFNALYGLKSSSHDYQEKNVMRMDLNKFTRLHLSVLSTTNSKMASSASCTPMSMTSYSEAPTTPIHSNR